MTRTEFMLICIQRYHAMEQRIRRSHYCKGREIPFDVRELHDWLEEKLGGEDGHTTCEYCATPISIQTLQLDHRRPIAQGGDLGLDNLALACEPCNQQKGSMMPVAFTALLRLVNDPQLFNHVDRTDCLGRLQKALKLAIVRGRKPQTERVRIVPHVKM